MKKHFFSIILFLIPLLSFSSPPPASEVFHLSAKQIDPNTFSLDWQIEKGFLLYKDRIKLIPAPDSNFKLGTISLPPALKKTNTDGKIESVYRGQAPVTVAILGEQPGEALLTVNYQGCADEGFCYPPQTQVLKLTINNNLGLSDITLEEPVPAEPIQIKTTSQTDKLTHLFATSHWIFILLTFFGFGLLLSFTPCVLPMVPVLSGIIVGHGNNISTQKAFFLSLAYVLSMSVTYAAVGAVVAEMGSNLQIIMQSPWAISLYSLLFIALAFSMFGFYDLRLPVALQAPIARITRNQSTGHYMGAAVMGCLSTLILSPCVTAPLIGVLGYIAQSGNVSLGTLALFFLGLGMGTPLLLIGASAGKLLPKAGIWMNAVKGFFGVMMLAVAIYLLDRLLPAFIIMWMWASLLIFSGIFTGAFRQTSTYQEQFSKGLGLIFLVYGFLILIGASQGNTNPVLPLLSPQINNSSQIRELKPDSNIKVTSLNELQSALLQAHGKPIMLDFYADWCASCKDMAKTTLQNNRIRKALSKFQVITVDITENDANANALLKNYNVIAPPTFLFLDPKGEELNSLRLVGEVPPNTFYSSLKAALNS